MSMSATRLLVLGAIRIMQPVHGYDVRRELLTWRLEELANIKPGSVYSAIRTLLKDGCVAVHSRDSDDSRPEKTSYVITAEGEKEFQLLLRESWWSYRSPSEPLIPALCLMPFMSREELIRALGARVSRLEGELESSLFLRSAIRDGATGADGEVPEHVREVLDFVRSRWRAEVEWSRALQRKLRDGTYTFSGEEGFPVPTPGVGLRPRA